MEREVDLKGDEQEGEDDEGEEEVEGLKRFLSAQDPQAAEAEVEQENGRRRRRPRD